MHDVGPALDGYTRISGWVSVSQLARKSMGNAMAESAAKDAQKELEALPDTGERCQYVLGVAEEVGQSQGDDAAIALLTKGGEWAKGITDSTDRRGARLAFAIALFNLNAYEGGVASLRGEEDATWSSDTMLAIASRDADKSRSQYDEGSAKMERLLVAPTAAAPAPQVGQLGSNGISGSNLG